MQQKRPFIVIPRHQADTVWPGMRVYRPEIEKKSEIGSKGLEPLLPHLTQEQRIQRYFEFCRAFDKREDHVIRDNFQQHSHRLHWEEHPYVDVIQAVPSYRDAIWFTLVFSFTNEHWITFKTLVDHGPGALRSRFIRERHARQDLFQIYWPKGTVVRDWIISGTRKAADDMVDIVRGKNRRWGMMNLAHVFAEYFRKEHGFSSALYPCKNFARYMAMGFPETVDPHSYIHPGTGSFRGFQQIFGGKLLMSSAKYTVTDQGRFQAINSDGEELYHQFKTLIDHRDNPVSGYQFINHEDKACFFFKRLAHEVGVQKATAKIPYTWIFPSDWNLKTGKYDRDPNRDVYSI